MMLIISSPPVETPLIHATRQCHLQTAKYLLDHGANPSVATSLGATTLHHAAGIGNIELLKLFLSKGVDVESESDAGTPLIWAAGHGQQDAVKLLQHNAKAGANPNISAGGATRLHNLLVQWCYCHVGPDLRPPPSHLCSGCAQDG